jgi:hypothetical protein
MSDIGGPPRSPARLIKRTSLVAPHMSAFGGKADIAKKERDLALG